MILGQRILTTMLKLFFWNIGRKSILDLVCTIVSQERVDFIILAECEIDIFEIHTALNESSIDTYYRVPGITERLLMFSRMPTKYIKPIRDTGGVSLRHISPPVGKDILLVAAHLPSKLYETDNDQTIQSTILNNIIDEAENEIGHSRTVLIGDLNMNPFEVGVASAGGLNAVMDRRIAKRLTRQVKGEEYKFFYNPMWNYFGDLSKGPPGTYYYNTGRHMNIYWNMFDQVLVRPDLLNSFKSRDLRIITKVNSTSLLNQLGRPDTNIGSDHLPILFNLRI